MKYRELRDQLNKLSDNQLELDAIVALEESILKVDSLCINEKDLYVDYEDRDRGLFSLDENEDSVDLTLIYKSGEYVTLITEL